MRLFDEHERRRVAPYAAGRQGTDHNHNPMNGAPERTIGLALSGGGSRAIAFHLGCLRALSRLGLLDRVAILSTVSGGSVIGAYFHAHFHGGGGDFASFETKIRGLLVQGLAAPLCRKLVSVTGIQG